MDASPVLHSSPWSATEIAAARASWAERRRFNREQLEAQLRSSMAALERSYALLAASEPRYP